MRRNSAAFTLIEVMMTLVIIVIVTSLGFITMSGYLPMQRLIRTSKDIENILIRAQAEAYSQSRSIGVQFLANAAGKHWAEMYIDTNNNYSRDVGEGQIYRIDFRNNVEIVQDGCANFLIAPASPCSFFECTVFFDQRGQAVLVEGTVPPTQRGPGDYEIIIYSKNLDAGNNAREVEVFGSGLVELVKLGQSGNARSNPWGTAPTVHYANTQGGTSCPP